MVTAALLVLLACLSGVVLSYVYLDVATPFERLVGGAVTGLLVLAAVGYALACVLTLGLGSMTLTVLVLLAPFLLLRRPEVRERMRREWAGPVGPQGTIAQRLAAWTCSLLLGALMMAVFQCAVYLRTEPGEAGPALYTGDCNNMSDLTLHLGIAASLLWGRNYPTEDIELCGHRFAYTILSDFQTAELMAGHGGLVPTMVFHDCILALVLVASLGLWSYAFIPDRRAAFLTPWLVIFNGGLGALALFKEMGGDPFNLLGLLPSLNHDYTINDTALRWGNCLNVLFITQRPLLMGVPEFLWVLFLFWRALTLPAGAPRNRLLVAAGVFTGLSFLVQSYLVMVLLVVAVALTMLFPHRRSWVLFFVTAGLLMLPQLAMLLTRTAMQPARFLEWHLGWEKPPGENIVVFWLENMGFFLPLLGAALLYRMERRRLLFYVPFLLCFVAANLFRLAPWLWDNIKVLFPWFVVSVPFVARMLADASRQQISGLFTAAMLSFVLCVSGMLDVCRVLSRVAEVKIFDSQQMAFASKVEQAVSSPCVILHAPEYNSPVYLTGERSLMGYQGHIWTRGMSEGHRPDDMRAIYQGDPQAMQLISEYNIRYIALTPQERETYPPVNEGFLSRFHKIVDWQGFVLYAVQH